MSGRVDANSLREYRFSASDADSVELPPENVPTPKKGQKDRLAVGVSNTWSSY